MSMFPDFNLYSTPLLILTIQGLVFAILLLKRFLEKKDSSDLFLALVLLITCYHQTSYTLGFMGWYDTYRNTKINYYLIGLSLALAPLIFFYVRSIVNPKKHFKGRDYLHFAPIFLFIIVKMAILIYDASQEGFEAVQNGYLVVNFQWKFLDPIITMLSNFQMLVYLVLSFYLLFNYREKIQHFFSNTFKLELNWLKAFLIIYTLLFLYQSIQLVVESSITPLNWRQEWWYYLLSGIAIIYIGIKGYFTDLSPLKGIEIGTFLKEEMRNRPSEGNGAQSDEKLPEKLQVLKNRIAELFQDKKPFLSQELTLISLAHQLGVSRDDLSETINKGFKLKFNDFINQHRTNEFKDRIRKGEHDQLSFLGIAYECGFNSKATFNRAFKKFTKKSPSEYLHSLNSGTDPFR